MTTDSIDLQKQTIGRRDLFLDLVSTTWNIFPHKEPEGYSPYEIASMYEIAENQQPLAKKNI